MFEKLQNLKEEVANGTTGLNEVTSPARGRFANMEFAGVGAAVLSASLSAQGGILLSPNAYAEARAIGLQTPGVLIGQARFNGTTFPFSAVNLGNGWGMTAAHNLRGTLGDATIDFVGNGRNRLNDWGTTSTVEQIYIHPEYNPSQYPNLFFTPDIALFRMSSRLDGGLALASSRPTVGTTVRFVGAGRIGYVGASGYAPDTGDVLGFEAPLQVGVPASVVADTMYDVGQFTPVGGTGKGSNFDSGGLATVYNQDLSRWEIVGNMVGRVGAPFDYGGTIYTDLSPETDTRHWVDSIIVPAPGVAMVYLGAGALVCRRRRTTSGS
jgi:hypothetical protein